MKKLLRVIISEIKKISKSTIAKVMMVGMAIFIVFTAVRAKTDDGTGHITDFSYQIQYNQAVVTDFNNANQVAYAKDVDDFLNELYPQLDELKIGYEDWRYVLIGEAESSFKTSLVYKYYNKGLKPEELAAGFNFDSVVVSGIIDEYKLATKEEQIALEKKAIDDYNLYKDMILNNDYKKYLTLGIKDYNKLKNETNKNIVELEKNILVNPNDETLKTELAGMKSSVQGLNENIGLAQYRIDEEIPFDEPPMTELEFNQNSAYEKRTYIEYLEDYRQNVEKEKENKLIAMKSLETGKPDLKFSTIKDLRKQMVDSLVFIGTISMFAVIIGGISIANEFSKGTIRLLLIRPVTRGKVITSKIVSVLLWSIAICVASVAVWSIISGVMFGLSDFSNPVYKVVEGVAIEGNFLLHFIKLLAISLVQIIFYGTFAIMLSTMFRSSAVAVALPILLTGAQSPIVLASSLAEITKNLIIYTPFPYVDVVGLLTNSDNMQYLISSSGIDITIGMGVPVLLTYSAIFVAITVLLFKKRDVTN